MGRRGGGSQAPSFRPAPPAEFEDETVFDWIRRQGNPIKPKIPASAASESRKAPKQDGDD